MASTHSRKTARIRRHRRTRKRLRGSAQRPRLAVFRSSHHIYAQLIDDAAGRTLAAASDLDADVETGLGTKTDVARRVGSLVARRATAAGHSAVVFDRGGFAYAGRVKALAEAAREEGLVF